MTRLFPSALGLAILLAVVPASWAQFQMQQQPAQHFRHPAPPPPQPAPPPPPVESSEPVVQSSPPPIVDDRGTEKSPLVVRVLKSADEIARESARDSARDTARDAARESARNSAFSNNAIILLGGGVAVLALLQLATFVVMLRTGRQQLRAYVQVNSAKIYNAFDGKGGPIAAHITIKNFGQTPAYKVTCASVLAVEKYPRPSDSNFAIDAKEFSAPGRSRTSLASGQTEEIVEIARRPALDEQEQRAVIDGQLAIFVIGEIRFNDVFGRSQHTKFRYMLGGPVGVRSGGSLVAFED